MDDFKQRLASVVLAAMRSPRPPCELDGANLVDLLGISSVDALEVLISVEIAFGIEIPAEDLDVALVSSLDALGAYVRRRQAADNDAV